MGHPRLRQLPSLDDVFVAKVVLNRTFMGAEPEFLPIVAQFTSVGINNLAISSSIHELGHVLGLRHEDAHPSTLCKNYKEDLDGSTAISGYNPFSFMSRCYYRSYNYNLGLLLPNELDITGLNLLYADLGPDQ
ncbi:MAG: hypothetical protein KBD78_06910 [Oligoflexales bacterium]|nr:hypothetical protein [Oligoflexales bacterium]